MSEIVTVIKRPFPITKDIVTNLMVTAIDSGYSNCWCGRLELMKPERACDKPWYDDKTLYDINSGVVFEVDEMEDDGTLHKTHTVTLEDIKTGFHIMENKVPWLFKDIEIDNIDAITADAWLQCVVLGDVIYG